jgi:hypothetical protein
VKRKKQTEFHLAYLLGPVVALVVLLCFLSGLADLQTSRSDDEREQLETAVRRAAVACYAAEGVYPPNLAYLQEHYGIQIDETRYTVSYIIFGSNMMPDITVLDNTL